MAKWHAQQPGATVLVSEILAKLAFSSVTPAAKPLRVGCRMRYEDADTKTKAFSADVAHSIFECAMFSEIGLVA